MFGSPKSGANAYAKVAMETGVLTASPHQLIVMLFDGAIGAIQLAEKEMKAGRIAAKSKAISHAVNIVTEGLRASLDIKTGGAIAENLDALYAYMIECLMMAHLKNQPEMLTEVQILLQDLRSAWIAIGGEAQTAAAAAPTAPVAVNMSAYGTLAPRAYSFASA